MEKCLTCREEKVEQEAGVGGATEESSRLVNLSLPTGGGCSALGTFGIRGLRYVHDRSLCLPLLRA